jgi:lactobin A/cerein 7B family class IIb bacteriocin
MNTREKSETRELTTDELDRVSGGIYGEIILIVCAAAAVIGAIGIADATGAIDSLVRPIQWPR